MNLLNKVFGKKKQLSDELNRLLEGEGIELRNEVEISINEKYLATILIITENSISVSVFGILKVYTKSNLGDIIIDIKDAYDYIIMSEIFIQDICRSAEEDGFEFKSITYYSGIRIELSIEEEEDTIIIINKKILSINGKMIPSKLHIFAEIFRCAENVKNREREVKDICI